jgi:RloB-like protein
MGSDDLFKKRKAKDAAMKRAAARLPAYSRILIVCEGEKTEPNYFAAATDHFRLNQRQVVVDGQCGSSPSSVFEHARTLFQAATKEGCPFDHVFCVFDRDLHGDYETCCDAIGQQTPKNVFEAITSEPCFEFWFLLHFKNTSKPYLAPAKASKKQSAAQQVIADLKDYWPDYQKSAGDTFEHLKDRVGKARQRAADLWKNAEMTGCYNPSTRAYVVLEKLASLNSGRP